MEQKLIFGFLPAIPEEDLPKSIAFSLKDDFRATGTLTCDYPENFHQMFRSWESMGLMELCDSIFEYPVSREDFIKQYLEYNGVEHDADFQNFLDEAT